ncbi:MAG TPA: DUF5132 domain-containing protein [Burkholderiaceae bacterium]|jgi:hypothetical protein|nr:DUF5132 domain-containing protein [Burkholderiaceae bacterium]
MAIKNNFVVGITAGLAATVLAPILIPAIKKSARPLAKSLVKGGFMLYEKGREAVAEAGEMMEDVIAETQAEMMAEALKTHAESKDVADDQSMSSQPYQPARDDNGNDRSSVVRMNASN